MKKRISAILATCLISVLAVSAFAFAGCSSQGAASSSAAASSAAASSASASKAAADTRQITDVLGRTVDIPKEPESVIGIGASSLRAICYMGQQDKVVGVELSEQEDSVTCTYRHVNVDKFKDLPVIGEGGSKGVTPNEEAIISANPDVVIASIDKDTADALQQKINIPVVCIAFDDKVFDQNIYDNLTVVGDVLNCGDRANEVIAFIQDAQADLQKRVEGQDSHTAYAAGVSFRGGHGFAGTEAVFAPFNSVNLTNIVDGEGVSGCFDVDLEKVSSAQPDYIFVETSNMDLVKEDVNNNLDYFKNLTAVQNNNVYSLVSYRFYQTNLDLAIANCYQVGKCAYPEQFEDIDPTQKLGEITEFFLGKDISADLTAGGYEFKQVDLLG